jgi:hypothetical protein
MCDDGALQLRDASPGHHNFEFNDNNNIGFGRPCQRIGGADLIESRFNETITPLQTSRISLGNRHLSSAMFRILRSSACLRNQWLEVTCLGGASEGFASPCSDVRITISLGVLLERSAFASGSVILPEVTDEMTISRLNAGAVGVRKSVWARQSHQMSTDYQRH